MARDMTKDVHGKYKKNLALTIKRKKFPELNPVPELIRVSFDHNLLRFREVFKLKIE